MCSLSRVKDKQWVLFIKHYVPLNICLHTHLFIATFVALYSLSSQFIQISSLSSSKGSTFQSFSTTSHLAPTYISFHFFASSCHIFINKIQPSSQAFKALGNLITNYSFNFILLRYKSLIIIPKQILFPDFVLHLFSGIICLSSCPFQIPVLPVNSPNQISTISGTLQLLCFLSVQHLPLAAIHTGSYSRLAQCKMEMWDPL